MDKVNYADESEQETLDGVQVFNLKRKLQRGAMSWDIERANREQGGLVNITSHLDRCHCLQHPIPFTICSCM